MAATANKPAATTKDTESTSSKVWGFLKYAIPAAAAVGAIATCVLFPPAATFLAPAVEWLAANAIPAFASAYAGLISFSTITAGIAAAAAVVTRLSMAAGEAIYNACTDKKAPAKAAVAKPEAAPKAAEPAKAANDATAARKEAPAPVNYKSPVAAAPAPVAPAQQQTLAPGMGGQ